MSEAKQELIAQVAAQALSKWRPKTQYECAQLGARISIAIGDIPRTDDEFINAAFGQAKGLFGPAFEAADCGQRSAWIDMCERALREAAGAERL